MPVSKSEAEGYINEYLRIKKELIDSGLLDQIDDSNTRAYYSSEYISFVFRKDRIDALFQGNPEANAVRIYYGAHNDGEPTIVIVPCQNSADDSSTNNKLFSPTPADQWPDPKGTFTANGINGGIDLGNDPI